jgi:Flp pilus assembly protein TadD
VRIKPDYAEAHDDLAIAYANDGRIDEAAKHFRRAIELRPDFQAARDNLNALLAPTP